MVFKFLADENVPFQVVRVLRDAGYNIVTVGEVARPGIGNNELAELSIKLNVIIIIRDADFTRLRRSLMKRLKVIYVRLSGDPNVIAKHVLGSITKCINILRKHNVVMIDEEGCHKI